MAIVDGVGADRRVVVVALSTVMPGGLVAECEDERARMLCSHPFIRDPRVSAGDLKTYVDARLDATPFPCGQCLACRINQAREWTTRILLESLVYSESLFVTLTYEDSFLMGTGCSLMKKDLQNYLKRLRKKLGKFRYFAIGEYGDKNLRPHYHLILFGIEKTADQVVRDCWTVDGIPIGLVDVGEVNEYSARYIAGYTTSKVTKREKVELINRPKEFMICSKMEGGIGIKAVEKMAESIKKSGQKVGIIRTIKIGGKEKAIGRYLTRKLAKFMDVDEKEFDASFWIHQEAIFKTFVVGEGYYDRLMDFMKPKLTATAKKHKIFSQRRDRI